MNDCRQYHTDKKERTSSNHSHVAKPPPPAFISVSGTASRLKHVMQKKDDAETEEAYADLPERIFTEEDKHKASDKKHPNEHIHLYG